MLEAVYFMLETAASEMLARLRLRVSTSCFLPLCCGIPIHWHLIAPFIFETEMEVPLSMVCIDQNMDPTGNHRGTRSLQKLQSPPPSSWSSSGQIVGEASCVHSLACGLTFVGTDVAAPETSAAAGLAGEAVGKRAGGGR